MRSLITFALPLVFATSAQAINWDRTKRRPDAIPDRIVELHGVFKGEGKKDNKTAYILVYGILENNKPSGRFNIFLLSGRRTMGQVFEGEVVGSGRIALLPIKLTEDKSFLKTVVPPAGLLELVYDSRGRKKLIISSRNSTLTQDYSFDKVSDDIQLGPTLPSGQYRDRKNAFTAVTNGSESANIRGESEELGIKGTFYTVFELAGLMVLRSETIDSSLNVYSEPQIAGLVVSIYDGRSEKIIMGKATATGEPTPVIMLRSR